MYSGFIMAVYLLKQNKKYIFQNTLNIIYVLQNVFVKNDKRNYKVCRNCLHMDISVLIHKYLLILLASYEYKSV